MSARRPWKERVVAFLACALVGLAFLAFCWVALMGLTALWGDGDDMSCREAVAAGYIGAEECLPPTQRGK